MKIVVKRFITFFFRGRDLQLSSIAYFPLLGEPWFNPTSHILLTIELSTKNNKKKVIKFWYKVKSKFKNLLTLCPLIFKRSKFWDILKKKKKKGPTICARNYRSCIFENTRLA